MTIIHSSQYSTFWSCSTSLLSIYFISLFSTSVKYGRGEFIYLSVLVTIGLRTFLTLVASLLVFIVGRGLSLRVNQFWYFLFSLPFWQNFRIIYLSYHPDCHIQVNPVLAHTHYIHPKVYRNIEVYRK